MVAKGQGLHQDIRGQLHDEHASHQLGRLSIDRQGPGLALCTPEGYAERMKLVDNWKSYASALEERFRNASERHSDYRKMKQLKYKNDIQAYITEMSSLNETVQWSGISFQTQISQELPCDDIIKMVYSRQAGIPDSDRDFLAAVQEAGLIYENMLANPGINSSGKGAPTSTSENSKSGQANQGKNNRSAQARDQSSKNGQGQSALAGIDQTDIDQYKKDKKPCWRCGRDNHMAPWHVSLRRTSPVRPCRLPQKKSPQQNDHRATMSKRKRNPHQPRKYESMLCCVKTKLLDLSNWMTPIRIFDCPRCLTSLE
ncbi:hypothetical protein F4804DRAFT_211704 [Jackrogersella minutella]|nr:hypothetical protein F4804DRAFT_211704 [Jackrogersella minutella]